MGKSLLLCFLLLPIFLEAQERNVLGRVLDRETKKPIGNANIIIFGTPNGAVSNAGGFFEVQVSSPHHKTLIVSHVGFKTSEVPIPAENRFMFYLERERVLLNEVVLEDYPKPVPELSITPKEAGGDFAVVESNASYPGGMGRFYDLLGNELSKNLTLRPAEPIHIDFTIDPEGKATQISVSDSTLNSSEILSAFANMPAWIAGEQRHTKVSQQFRLPVRSTKQALSKGWELSAYAKESIRYPLSARRMAIEGPVAVKFRVHEGTIISPVLLLDIGGDCGKEVIRVLKTAPVVVVRPLGDGTYILPVNFGLDQEFVGGKKPSITDEILLPQVHIIAIGSKLSK